MSFTKTYFLCPSTDFIPPPPTGPLCLGSIISSTSTPQYTLNKGSIVAVNDELPPLVETNWKKTVSGDKELALGVYAQFLQLATGGLPVGSEADFEHSTQTTSTFAFDTVTTLVFEPSQDYVTEAVKAPAVQAWLREPRQKFALSSELFIVTGMKIVKGAKINYSASQRTTAKGNLGINVPLGTTFGPKGQWTNTNDDEMEFDRASEFVFAFRVKRLKFGRGLKVKEYNKGAFMAVGGKSDNEVWLSIEDVNGAGISAANAVHDLAENGDVYCVPA
jgi:hypothetical protein